MQGFNMGRYYPPDSENAPRFNQSSHPLGARAKKITQGILTVRFELPFAVWCQTCKPEAIIGQGVRFNAEKKKVGTYYSTPIWSFRMKHSACGGWWEIRTDPKNAEYIVVEGARRRDYGPDDVGKGEGELKFLTEEERERRRNDAFASLEGKIDEKGVEKKNRERVEELYEQAEVWRDPYTANQKLRRDFRVKRKMLEKEGEVKEGMQDKFSFGFDIADELETDRVKASLVDFEGKSTTDRNGDDVSRKPLFNAKDANKAIEVASKINKLKSEILADKSRQSLQTSLVSNTRAAIDPFLAGNTRANAKEKLGILKRKRVEESASDASDDVPAGLPSTVCSCVDEAPIPKITLTPSLVDYDSE